MNVLVINAGSSSLKYQLINVETHTLMAKGICERVGSAEAFHKHGLDDNEVVIDAKMADHDDAMALVLESLVSGEGAAIASLSEIDAVGHRIVQGGKYFDRSVLIDDDVIAKIESRTGVDNLQEIMRESDGIMVARGDLGVEIPYEELPDVQKNMINQCRIYGKRVITATEMLESMIHNPRPTRAEISDVANAVYDGTSAVMLSGETAAGEYPVRSVDAMAKIVERAENHVEYIQQIDKFAIKTSGEALSHAASLLANDLGAKAIVVCTRTGSTARMVSRFRPNIPIIGLTTDPCAYQKLALSWGVQPFKADEYGSIDVLFYFAKVAALKSGFLKKGDKIVITGGSPNGKSGNTNLICVETL